MSTIKDVAKLAEVSIGTVSNVINGKTKNEAIIRRVEQAMKELSYRPDVNARSLKITKSNLIGVIIPDVSQPEHAKFLAKAESIFREHGYDIYLKLSRNNKLIEKKSLERCYEQGVSGIIFYSSTTKNEHFFDNYSGIPMVLIGRKETSGAPCDQIVINYKAAFEKALQKLKQSGMQKVGLIIEKDLLDNVGLLETYHKYYIEKNYIKYVDNSSESAFQAFFELYSAYPSLEAVITGCTLTAVGVEKAKKALDLKEIPLIAIKESNWIEDEGNFTTQISVSPEKLAFLTSGRLLEAIRNPALHEALTEFISAEYDEIQPILQGIIPGKAKLNFAMLDGPSARSLQVLSRIYEKESGISIDFNMLKYDELENLLYEHADRKDSTYDGFMMDIPWVDGLVETGYVKNLDNIYSKNRSYFDGFIDDILKNYGMYVESLYGIPFMSGAQLLYYQKDLFEDQTLKIRFKRLYGEELTPPVTWPQFNLAAEFFTQEYNSNSPVKYGASLVQGVNAYTTISFLNHLWAYGSSIFDNTGKVVINNSSSAAALANFKKNYQYASNRPCYSWLDVAEEFQSGASAMTILYDSDAGDINNYTKSKVAGNLGFSLIPGKSPVLGGWNLSLNAYTRHKKEAENFLLWACATQNAIPLSLLGGSTLRQDYYNRTDLENLKPWKPLVLESYRLSKKRYLPEIIDDSRYKNSIYTHIIPKQLQAVIEGRIAETQALENMEAEILSRFNGSSN